MEEENNHKPYDYSHYSLGSKPSITTEKIDTEIAHVLNLLNEHPDVTKEQLIYLENVIKQKIQEKEDKYLIPSRNTQTTQDRRIQFAEGTKNGGKRRKTHKNYKRKKRWNGNC